MAVIPHLRIPFRIGPTGTADVVEQNSIEEISQCVQTLVKTHTGDRVEVPEYGIPEQPFLSEHQAATAALAALLERWEPRAEINVSSAPNRYDSGQRDLRIVVRARADVRPSGELDVDAQLLAPTLPDPTTPGDPETPSGPQTWDSLGTLTWDEFGSLTWDQL